MLGSVNLAFLALVVLGSSSQAYGREQWLEGRDGFGVTLNPRRFGQEMPPVISKLQGACFDGICDILAGIAVGALLSNSAECAQQDVADSIIDASKEFDLTIQANMLAIAREYRQAEKNTPPDTTTTPATPRKSVYCQKAPKNSALKGLVQAQDPDATGNLFYDPATRSSVRLGQQPNTFPFKG